jgi:hypothetical protein
MVGEEIETKPYLTEQTEGKPEYTLTGAETGKKTEVAWD